MKKSRLKASPRESLSMSTAIKFTLYMVFKIADLFGFWKRPVKDLPADFEDWSLIHKFYWAYKSKKPVLKPEKGSGLETFFKENHKEIKLPQGFKKKSTLTFAAVGDLIKVDGLENSKNLLYEDTADIIFNKDVSYANLESQLTKQEIDAYNFNKDETPPLCCTKKQYDALKGHKKKKFDVMHTACNHTLDMGMEGVTTTLEQLDMDGIVDLGTNREKDEQQKGRIIKKKGMKIGFVSATLGLNGKEIPQGNEHVVNVVKFHKDSPDLSLLKKQISHCKDQGCDVVIASLHWGYEYEFYPRKHQVEAAHDLVEMGADMIIAHHSHVIQPVEYYRTKRDPDRAAVIAYSLGNLTSGFSAPHLVLSQVLNLTFAKGVIKGKEKTYIESAEMIPVLQVETEVDGLPAIQVKKLGDVLRRVKEEEDQEEWKYVSKAARYAELILGESFH